MNQLNHNTAEKKIAFLTEQLADNKAKWDDAVQAMEVFQNKHRLVDPSASLSTYHNIIAGIEMEIAKKTSEYNQLLRYMSPDTMEASKLKNEIEEQKAALDKMKKPVVRSGKTASQRSDLRIPAVAVRCGFCQRGLQKHAGAVRNEQDGGIAGVQGCSK